MKRKAPAAFTLIEMLIVIVIIGILAAALVPRLQAVQGRARDTKRKADMLTYVNAFEVFRADNARRPVSPCCVYLNTTGSGDPWITGLSTYMTSLPVDPINNIGPAYIATGYYTYSYLVDMTRGNPGVYNLVTQLENRSDPDIAMVQGYKLSYGGNFTNRFPSYNAYVYTVAPYRFGATDY